MEKVETRKYLVTVTPLPGHFPKRRDARGLRTLTGGNNGTRSLTQTQETQNEWVRRFKTGATIAKIAGHGTRFIRPIVPNDNPLGFPEYEFETSTGERVIASNICELREKLAILALNRMFQNILNSKV